MTMIDDRSAAAIALTSRPVDSDVKPYVTAGILGSCSGSPLHDRLAVAQRTSHRVQFGFEGCRRLAIFLNQGHQGWRSR